MEKAFTIRDWYEEHEDEHAGQPCAGKPFLDFMSGWAAVTAYIDDRFLFEEVGGTLMMVHHTRHEWIQMAVAMRLLESGIPVLPENVSIVEVDDPDAYVADLDAFETSVLHDLDGLDSER